MVNNNFRHFKRKKPGFSFMEILVSLVLIVALSVGAFFVFNEAQQTRKLAQMHNDMDAIMEGLLAYEATNIDSELPDDLNQLISPGLSADESVDGAKHENFMHSYKFGNQGFRDPWGGSYIYTKTDRSLTCHPKDTHGVALEDVVKRF